MIGRAVSATEERKDQSGARVPFGQGRWRESGMKLNVAQQDGSQASAGAAFQVDQEHGWVRSPELGWHSDSPESGVEEKSGWDLMGWFQRQELKLVSYTPCPFPKDGTRLSQAGRAHAHRSEHWLQVDWLGH